MKKFVNGLLMLCFVFGVSSCHHVFNDDDSNPPMPPNLPDLAADYIIANYPDHVVQSVDFEDICDDNLVLEVELEDGPGPDVDLYFETDGTFLLAEYDIAISDLPDAVVNTIETEFSGYSINSDDVERWEMADGTIQYEVKLEPTSGATIEVVFDENGNILCQDTSGSSDDDDGDDDNGDDDNGNDDNISLDSLPPSISEYINANYSSYTQINIEFEDPCGYSNVYEVELEDGAGPDVDLYFSLEGDFLFAATEIDPDQIPEGLVAIIETEYSDYEIEDDEVERYDMADGTVRYKVELERDSGSDLEVVFNPDGSVACTDD